MGRIFNKMAAPKKEKKQKETAPPTPVNLEERRALDIRPGDTVKVTERIREGNKSRLQMFDGLVLAVKHGREAGGTFTVRKVLTGIGVEKIFPRYSPSIEKIEITRRSKVRRAKLYYIRHKAAREISRQMQKERRERLVPEKAEEVTEAAKPE